jgi:hypothetical protein
MWCEYNAPIDLTGYEQVLVLTDSGCVVNAAA